MHLKINLITIIVNLIYFDHEKIIRLVIHTHYTNSILFLNIILCEKNSPVSNSEKDHLFEIKNTQLLLKRLKIKAN